MAWRVVVIENPSRLSVKDNKLNILQEEEFRVPLEDIDTLVLDGDGIVLTLNLLAELAKYKVNVVICDDKHLPNSSLLAYSQASRGAKIARAQVELREAARKQLWRKCVVAKISNQAAVLRASKKHYSDLLELAKAVRSGDTSNNESIAARLYFERILDGITRRVPAWSNSALNYGYAIVRSTIARSVAARGLICSIGINHCSELNQYNLADDLIEPFRPYVDLLVLSLARKYQIGENDLRLTKEQRHDLVDILNNHAIVCGKRFRIKDACDMVVENFCSAILADETDLFELPTIK